MAILDFPFKCPNGHSFRANAKIRARCPECTAMSKRDNAAPTPVDDKPTEEPKVDKPKEPESRVKPTLVRRGRPRITMAPPVKSSKSTKTVKSKLSNLKPKTVSKTASGIVRTHRVTSGNPKVTRPPKRTAIARHIQTPRKESIIDSVMRRFGPG